MFHIVSGPFQPVLELSLVKEIQELKSADPFASLAIVVPSEMLRRRLQWLLCVEHSLALYDVHFLTFHQLALRLYDEGSQWESPRPNSSIELVSDLTLQQLLREVLGRDISDLKALSWFRESPGLCAALWSTIRDLDEAMIDPSAVLQGIDEGLFEPEALDNLRTLFSLQTRLHEETQHLQIGSPDDLAKLVIPWVTDSSLLARLSRVCYYGFYDLSQVQLSFFEAVTQKSRVTVYFPLLDDPAFAFAQRFYDRHLSTGIVLTQEKSSVSTDSKQSSPLPNQPVVKIVNSVGPEDELMIVCKMIGDLIELHGYTFEEIGVVARILEPYQSWLGRTFEQHRIPFTSSALLPIIHEPVIKLLLQLGGLVLKRFPSNDILDIVRSPYYRANRLTDRYEYILPEVWKEVVQRLGITRGEEQWLRLSTVVESDTNEVYRRVTESRRLGQPESTLESLRLFNRLVQELIVDCQALLTSGRIDEHTEAFLQLLHKHLVLPGLDVGGQETRPSSLHDVTLADIIQHLLVQLKQLGGLQATMTWEQWMGLLLRVAEDGSLPFNPGPRRGVRVLDAMAARGLPFRAVFVIGLNEKVFPRFIREDAFLRDAHRRVLAETFGYKIEEKFAGYDEERLLFALLKESARDRLYLSYQRADEEGRLLTPSSFLREMNRHDGPYNVAHVFSLPRRFSDRLDDSFFRDSLLTREELGLKLILKGMNPSLLLERFGRESSLFQQGWNASADIERHARELGGCDGILGPIEKYWENLTLQGISPTALECYARCPFQYFVTHLLKVHAVRFQMTDELSPSVIGTLCHAVLNQVYVQLIHKGWPDRQLSSHIPETFIASALEEVFVAYERENPTGYGVVWQFLKDVVETLVRAEVEVSREECVRTGFRPMAVEVDAEGQIELPESCVWSSGFKIYGRLDRVDCHDETKGFRIIDYKIKLSAKMKSGERDLLASGIRGTYLQPSLYSLMSEYRVRTENGEIHHALEPERVDFVYLAPHRTPVVDRAVFESSSWETMRGQQLKKTMGDLLTGIKDGQYFILPGNYCEYCALSTVCRRFHAPTMNRSYRSEQAKRLRQIRKQEIGRD